MKTAQTISTSPTLKELFSRWTINKGGASSERLRGWKRVCKPDGRKELRQGENAKWLPGGWGEGDCSRSSYLLPQVTVKAFHLAPLALFFSLVSPASSERAVSCRVRLHETHKTKNEEKK